MEESKETNGLGNRIIIYKYEYENEKSNGFRKDRHRSRGYNTRTAIRRCIVDKCNQDHPPWVCPMFKALEVPQRKELITESGRCYGCLAAGHHSRDCKKVRVCGIAGFKSTRHSSYLHGSLSSHGSLDKNVEQQGNVTNAVDGQSTGSESQLQPEASTFSQRGPTCSSETSHAGSERGHKTSSLDSVSLMILPAIISNGNRTMRVNVMLDTCSTSSYVTEEAAAELGLQGEPFDLTISGTSGPEIKQR